MDNFTLPSLTRPLPRVRSGLDASFAGAVVRFDRDGRISRQASQSSPVLAYGYSRPTFVTVDPALRSHLDRWDV